MTRFGMVDDDGFVVPGPRGTWARPPARTMSEASRRYEEWVRLRSGGPSDAEFRVTHPDGPSVWFDAVGPGVLREAKGHYSCFVDRADADWFPWYRRSRRSGLQGLLGQARRQVEVAAGWPVEWWCAEAVVAELLYDEFRASPRLAGRVVVRHEPMPGW